MYVRTKRVKAIERKLNFGARCMEDVFDATLGAEIGYWSLPDRKTCVVCGKSRASASGGPEADAPTRAEGYGRIIITLCSPGCRQVYREWLRD